MKCDCGKPMTDVRYLWPDMVDAWYCAYCLKRNFTPPAYAREITVNIGFAAETKAETKPDASDKCATCKKRETYVWCSRCSVPLCAMCSWTVSVPMPGRNGVVDERCRKCVEKA